MSANTQGGSGKGQSGDSNRRTGASGESHARADGNGSDLRRNFVATQAVSLWSMLRVSSQVRRTWAGGW